MKQAVLILPIALVAACSASNGKTRDGADEGPDTVATRSFPATGFEGVMLAGSDDVRVVRGNGFAVSATGPERVLDQLEIEVKDGVLKVSRKRSDKWRLGWPGRPGGHATVTVTMPAIRSATIAGSGDMTVDRAEAERFKGAIAGSGDLGVGALKAGGAGFDIAGSGNIRVAGEADRVDISIAGSGDVDAAKLVGNTLEVSTAGSGSVTAYARGAARVSVIGSGNVRIAGTKDCEVTKMGSGEVSCA